MNPDVFLKSDPCTGYFVEGYTSDHVADWVLYQAPVNGDGFVRLADARPASTVTDWTSTPWAQTEMPPHVLARLTLMIGNTTRLFKGIPSLV